MLNILANLHSTLNFQGGGWCETISNCQYRALTDLSSKNMQNISYFTGVLSSDPQLNPGG